MNAIIVAQTVWRVLLETQSAGVFPSEQSATLDLVVSDLGKALPDLGTAL